MLWRVFPKVGRGGRLSEVERGKCCGPVGGGEREVSLKEKNSAVALRGGGGSGRPCTGGLRAPGDGEGEGVGFSVGNGNQAG